MQPYEAALTFLGVPFRHHGRSIRGLDCSGLLVLTARKLGFELQDLRHYGREPWRNGMQEALLANFGPPVQRPYRVNDILLLQFPSAQYPSHLAIVAPHPHGLGMVHTHGELGRVAYHRICQRREKQIVGVYEWPAKS